MATDSELRADKVERIMDDIKMAEYMNTMPKETIFTALISEVSDCFIRVLLPNMISGKVYLNMKCYKLGKDGFSVYNPKTNEQLLVGDFIEVSLSKVNIETGEIVFEKSKNMENCYEEKKGKKKVRTR